MTNSVPTPRLSADGKKSLDDLLASFVAEQRLPAITFGATTADAEIYFAAKGDKVLGEPDKGQIDENTTLQLFSMTKFITSIACIQLWEKGLIDFDSEELLAKHVPELVALPILDGFADDGKPITHKRTKPLTLRHLLTHTSGLAYNFLSPELLGRYQAVNKTPSFLSKNVGIEALLDPLLFEPGTTYSYGTGIDWAGVLVERISGQNLQEYFDEHIFKPLGISMTFYPTPEVVSNLQQLCGRDEQRNLVHTTGLRDVPNLKPEDIGLLAGGAGLLGTAKDYMRLCAGVLACKDKAGILSPKGYELVFESALPPREQEGKEHTCYAGIGRMHAILGITEEQYTSGAEITHSLACARINARSKYGRNAGTVNWGGIAKTQWWIDPVAGIAGFCGTQLMDMVDPSEPMRVWKAYETALYAALG